MFSLFIPWNKLILHSLKDDTFYPVCVSDENICIAYIYIKLYHIRKLEYVNTYIRYFDILCGKLTLILSVILNVC